MRCLLVDDSVHFLEEAQRTLQREGFCVVGVAATAPDALDLVASHSAELLLLDMDLGPDSGLDLLAKLARESLLASMRVILISAHDESDFAELIYSSSAAGFVAKAQLSATAIYDVLEAVD